MSFHEDETPADRRILRRMPNGKPGLRIYKTRKKLSTMVQISKHLFDSTCRDMDCYTMLHPWNESCWKSVFPLFMHSTIGSAKFYAVVYAIQIVMRGKKMLRKEEWIKMGEYYVRSTLLGLMVCATAPSVSCTIRRLLGNFNYYTYLLVPFGITGLYIYLEPPSRRGLVINLFCNLFIEYWLRNFQRAGHISVTRTQQTFMFMLGSAILFYLMRLEGDKKERTPLFWLYTPEKVRKKTPDDPKICPHNGPCHKYIAKGYTTYFGIGLAISLARAILPKIKSPMKAISSVRSKHFKLALFFGSYIGIYRAVICYLCRKKGFDSAEYALPAGYLAGLSFLFSPSLGLSIASVTAAFKLYSTILYEKKILPTSIPLPELLYCICQGALFNARIIHPETCPGYVFNLMKTVSNGRAEWINDNFLKVVTQSM